MKLFCLILSVLALNAYAFDCETLLLEKINKDPNIKLLKTMEFFTCGDNACAITFLHDSHPYPNAYVLAFLDQKNAINVNWVPLNNGVNVGHQSIKGKKISYVNSSDVVNDKISLKASIETARDAIFWPPHKVYFEEQLVCIKK